MKVTEFIGVFGDVGSGKTLFTTYLAYKLHNERKIYSNYHIYLDNCFLIKSPSDLLKIGRDENALVILDEAYTWLEARVSASKINRLMSYLIFQSRKRNFDVVFTAQIFTTIDVRLRKLVDVIVYCERRGDSFVYEIMTTKFTCKLVMDWSTASKLFKLYDTTEIILPLSWEEELLSYDVEELKKMAKEIAKKIIEKLGEEKITKNDVKSFIIENNYPPQQKLVDLAYYYLKQLRQRQEKQGKKQEKRKASLFR